MRTVMRIQAFSQRPLSHVPGACAGASPRRHVEVVYSDLLEFMGRLDTIKGEDHQQFWMTCQMAALQLRHAVGLSTDNKTDAYGNSSK